MQDAIAHFDAILDDPARLSSIVAGRSYRVESVELHIDDDGQGSLILDGITKSDQLYVDWKAEDRARVARRIVEWTRALCRLLEREDVLWDLGLREDAETAAKRAYHAKRSAVCRGIDEALRAAGLVE